MLRKILILAGLAIGAAQAAEGLRYDGNGALLPPDNYRDWVFLTASLDMNYAIGAAADHSMFDNVFVDPQSWAQFKRSGHWPDGTVMVKEMRGARTEGSINRSGQFQSDEVMALEVHLRDDRRFKGWRFFEFGDNQAQQPIPLEAECYSCHQQNGAVDTTFTQFYPLAKAIAVKMGSFKG